MLFLGPRYDCYWVPAVAKALPCGLLESLGPTLGLLAVPGPMDPSRGHLELLYQKLQAWLCVDTLGRLRFSDTQSFQELLTKENT